MIQNFLRRDLLGRAHGSFLGIWWMLLNPLVMFAVYFLIFGMFLGNWKVGQPPDPTFAIYLFSGVIVFNALVESTTHCCQIVVDNGNLVKKVAFPSEALVIHIGIVSMVLYLVGAVVCVPVGAAIGVLQPGWLLLALPLVLAVQFVLTIGIGLLLANAYVFVRDVVQLWRIATMIWMFLTPVFWTPDLLAEKGFSTWFMGALNYGNPAASLLQAHRIAMGFVNPPELPPLFGDFWVQLAIAAAWATGFLLLGYSMFMASKHKYADLV
jgi:ABC-type polysaccharide/polyol phosphate export permease